MERSSDKAENYMNSVLKGTADRFSDDSWQYIANFHSQNARWYCCNSRGYDYFEYTALRKPTLLSTSGWYSCFWCIWVQISTPHISEIHRTHVQYAPLAITPVWLWFVASLFRIQSLDSLSGKTFYRNTSWSLGAARFKRFQLLWNLTGISVASLPRSLSKY